ncbi:unnamed protein product [Penicillium roqueforti FM164]|uniref:Genomic scaffold, ProqFM164S02 n=1 Tax=Penicillium roqueforti (strain FM164) TaxID=1365484 RepID=W6QDC7_PENRF|nr:unnamed protein product [Penicillium roqueforti FM164]
MLPRCSVGLDPDDGVTLPHANPTTFTPQEYDLGRISNILCAYRYISDIYSSHLRLH